ncbi:hypothetical protein PV325_012026 [Microctonus aethiopoides]|nr:hypothetical protein PV325_012026 [Microctonus aethiopoides]KAK0072174.1 hypothetical protein PV326_000337 [Microctonus aethiopoides]
MESKTLWLVLFIVKFCAAWMDERPVLESIDGNLIISGAKDKNITIKILGNGYFNVHDIDLISVAVSARSASRLVERWRDGYLQELMEKVRRLLQTVEGPYGLDKRISLLEHGADPSTNSSNWRPYKPSTETDHQGDEVIKVIVRALSDRVRRIESRLRTVISKLRQNKCANNPCQNGGTCIRIYDGYQCICPSNWEVLTHFFHHIT